MRSVEDPAFKHSFSAFIKIGELAERAGVAVGTVRYYESLGLLQPDYRSESGYRYYGEAAQRRLVFIKKAQSLQFSLLEIQQILGVRRNGDPACPMVQDLLRTKIADLETQIERMHSLKRELETYQQRWQNKPFDQPRSDELCSLIEDVACKEGTNLLHEHR